MIYKKCFHGAFSKSAFVKNKNFGQTLKFWSKIEILVKNKYFGTNSKVGQNKDLYRK